MGMDSAVIRALCIELSDKFSGAKVRTIEQFTPWEFAIRTDRGDILISCHQRFKRIIHFSANEQPSGSHFTRTAEDLLHRSRIERIGQRDLDRIVEIDIAKSEPLSGDSTCRLVVELIGSSGNAILLTAEGKVLVTFRRSRRNVPGKPYRAPKGPSGIDPSRVGSDELMELLLKDGSRGLAESIQKSVLGFGPLISREAAYRAGLDPDVKTESCTRAELGYVMKEICTLHRSLLEARFHPTVYYDEEIAVEFSCFALSHLGKLRKREFRSMSDAVSQFHARTLVSERVEERKRFLLRPLKRRIRSVRVRLAKQLEDLGKARQAEQYRAKGDAILSNLSSLAVGLSRATLTNPHQPGETLEVEFAPGKSHQETAQEYFKKYKKMKRAVSVLEMKLAESKAELDMLERLKDALEDAKTEDDVGQLSRAFADKGVIQRAPAKRGRPEKQYRVFLTTGGWEVVVGRSREENDEITFRIAKSKDIFFHVSSAAGSHTVMRVQGKGRMPGKRDIEEAAGIAAYYSKARTSKLVSVSYTERRYVRKPRKAPPGTVTIEREKTVMVEPRKPKQ
jgi:predicted ribosome quality control (RQC) complex YloA/Tae2 family protein